MSLHITKQFVFDLTKEVDRKNYAMLRVHLASDKELAQIIKIYDPQANAIQKISSDRLIVTLKNKLYDIEKDEEIIAKYDQFRDFPALAATTKLGIHLRCGTISIRRLTSKVKHLNETFLN